MKRLKKPSANSSILDNKYIHQPQSETVVNDQASKLKKKPTNLPFLLITAILAGLSIWSLFTIIIKYPPEAIKNLIIPSSFLPLMIAFACSAFFSLNLLLKKSKISLLISFYLSTILFLKLQLIIFSIWLHLIIFFSFIILFLLINFPIWLTKKR